jgi:predicted kinase
MLSGEDNKYKAFNQKNESIVWETFYDILSTCKIKNKDIIISNTNCNLDMLKVLIDVFRGHKLEFVVMNTSKSICISRCTTYDKFEEEMIQTVKWLRDNGMRVKEIQGKL